uniref:BED-type domain-containing protein n=1 Tax=Spongospora subterranea TaxID=70186 RepID=A0A0H5RAW6_9EUKA|eukprot:CRZ11310.1 hypothetical protein [Spongospora subterranea]
MSVDNKRLVRKYFAEEGDDIWKCLCGKTRKRGKCSSNLLDHISRDHADTVDVAKTSDQPITTFFRKTDTNLFKWVKWIVKDLLPFNLCEKPNTRLYCKLEPVSIKTLKECMIKITTLAERGKIKDILPDQFAIVFDEWSHHSTHYLAVFAVFPEVRNEKGYDRVLLSFSL